MDFSSHRYFNHPAARNDYRTFRSRKKKQRSRHHSKKDGSSSEESKSPIQNGRQDSDHHRQNKVHSSDHRHNNHINSIKDHHKKISEKGEYQGMMYSKQSKDKLLSTTDTFGSSINSSLMEEEESQQQLLLNDQQQQQSSSQQIGYKIHLNAFHSVLTPEELKNMTIEESNYYKVLGEERVFHSRPGQLSQKIKEIKDKDNCNTISFSSKQVEKHKDIDQGQKKSNNDAEQLNEMYQVDLRNRYFISNDKQQVTCKRCKQIGHFERMCVKEIKQECNYCLGNHQSYYCSQRICFNCNQLGHLGKTCQNSKEQKCARCQKIAHTKTQCGAILLNNYSTTLSSNKWNKSFKSIEEVWKIDDDKKMKCMKCGMRGHVNCQQLNDDESVRDEVYGSQFRKKFKKQQQNEEIRKQKAQKLKDKQINFLYSDAEDDQDDNQIDNRSNSINGLKEQIKQIKGQQLLPQDDVNDAIILNQSQVNSKKNKKKLKDLAKVQKQYEEEQQQQFENFQDKKIKNPDKKKKKIDLLRADSKEDIVIHVSSENQDQHELLTKQQDGNNKEQKLNRKQKRQLLFQNQQQLLKSTNNNNTHIREGEDSESCEDQHVVDAMLAKNMLNIYHQGKNIKQVNEVEGWSEINSGYGSDVYLSEPEENDRQKYFYEDEDEEEYVDNEQTIAKKRNNKIKQKKLEYQQKKREVSRQRSRSSQQKHNHQSNNGNFTENRSKNARNHNIFNQLNQKNKNNFNKQRQEADMQRQNRYFSEDQSITQNHNKRKWSQQAKSFTKKSSSNNSMKKYKMML